MVNAFVGACLELEISSASTSKFRNKSKSCPDELYLRKLEDELFSPGSLLVVGRSQGLEKSCVRELILVVIFAYV
jgi:hypothetical protein